MMNTDLEKIAPYAPFGCVITVIRRFREKGLPEPLTLQEVGRVGVSEGNASRTLQALKFLGLVDEEGYRTPAFQRLGRVSTGEYAEVFAEIVREAYYDVFTVIDPATATAIEVNDAFRSYHPKAQRARMVTLFKGLCREVGLIAGGPPETRKRVRTIAGGKVITAHAASSRRLAAEAAHATGVAGAALPPYGQMPLLEQDLALLQGLLQQLPSDKRWTQERRDKWVQAFTASLDLLFTVEGE
jgi:hypothetical protein